MEPVFKTLTTRAKIIIAALGLTIIADLFSAFADQREIGLMNQMIDGTNLPSYAALSASDHLQSVSSELQLALLAVGAIAFLVWFSPAYKNLAALGAYGFRFSNGWAIGAWFVPFLSLWRPKQITDDIWRASDPKEKLAQGNLWASKSVPVFFQFWWAIWIVDVLLGNLAFRLTVGNHDASAQSLIHHDQLDLVVMALDIIAALLATAVVITITRRQEARASAIRAAGELMPAPD